MKLSLSFETSMRSIPLILLVLSLSLGSNKNGLARGASINDIEWAVEDFDEHSVGAVVRYLFCGTSLCADVFAKPGRPMIFNSSNPTAGDYDLGTPNIKSGGPGFGIGTIGAKTNTLPRGNVLIISDDGNRKIPNGIEDGGKFTFSCLPLFWDGFGILDNDKGFTVKLWDENKNLMYKKVVAKLGDNAYQYVPIKVAGATKLVIELNGSGAITEMKYARVPYETYFPGALELSPTYPYNCETSGLQFSIDGDTILAGNFVYQRNGSSWDLADQQLGDEGCFSPRNAISGNFAFVKNDFYVRNGDGTWALKDTIESDASTRVVMSGNTLVLGTEVYIWDGNALQLEATLTATEPDESFGSLASIDGNTILVGGTSKVYVFVRASGVWSQQAVLTAGAVPGAVVQDFGDYFDIKGNTVVVTGPVENRSSGVDGSALFIFERIGSSWNQRTAFTEYPEQTETTFTYSRVAIGADSIITLTKWYVQGWRWMYGGPVVTLQQFRHYDSSYGWVRLHRDQPTYLTTSDFLNVDISGSTLVLGQGWAPEVIEI